LTGLESGVILDFTLLTRVSKESKRDQAFREEGMIPGRKKAVTSYDVARRARVLKTAQAQGSFPDAAGKALARRKTAPS
jgi:hypothetical protein